MPRTQPPRKDKNRVPRVKTALPPAQTKDAERVAKVIARAGLGSRREIEDWILEGRIAVNGTVLTTPAFTVTAEDAITVDGAPLPERERTRLFLYHKPRGVVTTNKDPEGRTTLFEILPKGLPRLVSVGRLDLNSEGLLLLTNDGGLARVLELPETGWLRRYRVRAKGEIDQAQLDGLIKGITVEGVEYGPIEATLDRVQGANAWITVALREGKNREVRNVLGALGLLVNRLIRVSYGPFQLGEVPEGGIEEVRTRILRDQMGAEIIAASGADFDGPILDQPVEPPARRTRPEPAEDGDEERRPVRRGPPRRAEPEPEPRGRARRPRGEAEETASFRVRSRRGDEERELESRGTVSDRKGREIKVERVVKPREESRPGRSFDARPPRKGGQRGFDDARGEKPRFGRGRPGFSRDEGEFGGRPARGGARPPRRDERPRSEGDDVGFLPRGPRAGAERGERPARPFRERSERPEGGARPPRAGGRFGGDREERGERPARPFRERSERPEGGARPPRAGGRFGGDREERGERPARPFRERSERPEGGARPPRAGGRFGGDREERGERPARPFRERSERPEGGARPPRAGGRFGGDREERGERPARPFRERSERPEGGERPQRSGGFRSGGREDGPKGFKGGAGKRPAYGDARPRGPAGPGKGGPKGGPKGRPSGGFKAGPKGGGKGGPKGGPGGSGPRGRSSGPRSRG